MPEKLLEKEGEFSPVINYNGVEYEIGELTPNGTALYISKTDPPNKGDWPTCVEIDQDGHVVSSNLSK